MTLKSCSEAKMVAVSNSFPANEYVIKDKTAASFGINVYRGWGKAGEEGRSQDYVP